jgi:hypothetical protein
MSGVDFSWVFDLDGRLTTEWIARMLMPKEHANELIFILESLFDLSEEG